MNKLDGMSQWRDFGMMIDTRYYVETGDPAKGPYTIEELRSEVREKTLAKSVLVRAEGGTERWLLGEVLVEDEQRKLRPPWFWGLIAGVLTVVILGGIGSIAAKDSSQKDPAKLGEASVYIAAFVGSVAAGGVRLMRERRAAAAKK